MKKAEFKVWYTNRKGEEKYILVYNENVQKRINDLKEQGYKNIVAAKIAY